MVGRWTIPSRAEGRDQERDADAAPSGARARLRIDTSRSRRKEAQHTQPLTEQNRRAERRRAGRPWSPDTHRTGSVAKSQSNSPKDVGRGVLPVFARFLRFGFRELRRRRTSGTAPGRWLSQSRGETPGADRPRAAPAAPEHPGAADRDAQQHAESVRHHPRSTCRQTSTSPEVASRTRASVEPCLARWSSDFQISISRPSYAQTKVHRFGSNPGDLPFRRRRGMVPSPCGHPNLLN